MQTPRFNAKVENGKLSFDNLEKFKAWLFSLSGKEVSVVVEEWIDQRTVNQNALYWAYLGIIGEQTGNHPEDLHEVFKEEFLGDKRVVVEAFGKTAVRQPTTTRLNKLEFSDYMAKIEDLTKVPIPDPNEIMLNL